MSAEQQNRAYKETYLSIKNVIFFIIYLFIIFALTALYTKLDY